MNLGRTSTDRSNMKEDKKYQKHKEGCKCTTEHRTSQSHERVRNDSLDKMERFLKRHSEENKTIET